MGSSGGDHQVTLLTGGDESDPVVASRFGWLGSVVIAIASVIGVGVAVAWVEGSDSPPPSSTTTQPGVTEPASVTVPDLDSADEAFRWVGMSVPAATDLTPGGFGVPAAVGDGFVAVSTGTGLAVTRDLAGFDPIELPEGDQVLALDAHHRTIVVLVGNQVALQAEGEPCESSPAPTRLLVSDDVGRTWAGLDLPEPFGPSDERVRQFGWYSVATDATVTIVTGDVWRELDFGCVAYEMGIELVSADAEGLTYLDGEGEVITVSWDHLGLSNTERAIAPDKNEERRVALDRSGFDSVTLTLTNDEWGTTAVDAVTVVHDGSRFVASGPADTALWRSIDGVVWEEQPFPADTRSVLWPYVHSVRVDSEGASQVTVDGGHTWAEVVPPKDQLVTGVFELGGVAYHTAMSPAGSRSYLLHRDRRGDWNWVNTADVEGLDFVASGPVSIIGTLSGALVLVGENLDGPYLLAATPTDSDVAGEGTPQPTSPRMVITDEPTEWSLISSIETDTTIYGRSTGAVVEPDRVIVNDGGVLKASSDLVVFNELPLGDWVPITFDAEADRVAVLVSSPGDVTGGKCVHPVPVAHLMISSDGGQTWTREDLPFAEVDTPGRLQSEQIYGVVTSPEATLVARLGHFERSFACVAMELGFEDAWRSEGGVEAVSDGDMVEYSFEEFGFTPEEIDALNSDSGFDAFFLDGEWRKIDQFGWPLNYDNGVFTAGPASSPGWAWYFSTNGLEWSVVPFDAEFEVAIAAGGAIVRGVNGDFDLSNDGGTTWSTVELPRTDWRVAGVITSERLVLVLATDGADQWFVAYQDADDVWHKVALSGDPQPASDRGVHIAGVFSDQLLLTVRYGHDASLVAIDLPGTRP
ncbi:MAG: hypothetical protein GY708_20060 [Actinomycetia bacterium]|nr:hypothetical protein [Actinomycetes bacterium]MCP4959622.1 hypothetical protein [Actinomycetes bacterium]